MEIIVVMLIAVLAVGAVLLPLVRRRGAETLDAPVAVADDAALEAEIAEYRAALRAGTLCARCGYPNPAGSRFCAECGRALDAAAA
jgi:hypothetical protein